MSGQKKILVIEDEASLRDALVDKLTMAGYTVFSAQNGEMGLKLALQEHPDVILLDIMMPVIDGIEMARRLRQDDWGQKANVIVLTNLNSMEEVQKALEQGIFEYIVKADTKLENIVEHVKTLAGA